MTKAEMVAAMAKASRNSKASEEKALNAFLSSVRDSLKRGRRVTLVGFGTFLTSRRAARNGRNPQNGRPIKIPAARVPRFRSSMALKKAVK